MFFFRLSRGGRPDTGNKSRMPKFPSACSSQLLLSYCVITTRRSFVRRASDVVTIRYDGIVVCVLVVAHRRRRPLGGHCGRVRRVLLFPLLPRQRQHTITLHSSAITVLSFARVRTHYAYTSRYLSKVHYNIRRSDG